MNRIILLLTLVTLVSAVPNILTGILRWDSYNFTGGPFGLTGHSLNTFEGRKFIQFGGHYEQWNVSLTKESSIIREDGLMIFTGNYDAKIMHKLKILTANRITFNNKLFVLDLASGWTELTPSGDKPEPRVYHQSVYDPLNKILLIWGGVHFSNTYGNVTLLKDMWSYSVINNTWTRLADLPTGLGLFGASSTLRVTLSGFQAITFGGVASIVFGGFPIYTNTTWSYSLTYRTWTLFTGSLNEETLQTMSSVPSPRGFTQTFPLGGHIYTNGGEAANVTSFGFSNPDDTWRFTPSTATWTNVTNNAHNIFPSRQSAAIMPLNFLVSVIYGGEGEGNQQNCGLPFSFNPQNDTWIFSLFDNGWYKIETDGIQPMPLLRAAAACTTFTQECVITGGIDFVCPIKDGVVGAVYNPYVYVLSIGHDFN